MKWITILQCPQETMFRNILGVLFILKFHIEVYKYRTSILLLLYLCS